MAQYPEEYQRGPKYARRPWFPVTLYPRVRKYRTTTYEPTKERSILPVDRRMHASIRTAKKNSNIRTSPRSSRPRTTVYLRSGCISIRNRRHTLSSRQEDDGSQRKSDPLTLQLPLTDLLSHRTMLSHLRLRVPRHYPRTETLGLSPEMCKTPGPRYYGPCQPHLLSTPP
jgi:hypothetical protein